jgi:coenzyme F420-reducing hydrogenase alpha subunit
VLHPKGEECDDASRTGIVGGNSTAQDTVLDIDIAEEVVHVQMVGAEPDPDLAPGGLTRNLSARSRDPLLGEPESLEKNAHAHLESAEPETLMNVEDDWLQEVEEEGTAEVMGAVDDLCVDLQELGVSHLTTFEGTSILTSPLSQSLH